MPQNHSLVYPTLARIALDVLPCQASSVPCERLFSGTKQIATDRRAALGPVVFEELAIMNSAWGIDLCDIGAWNAAQEEEVGIPVFEYEQILLDDVELEEWVTAGLNDTLT
jgi:hAT family C-terminal dimerisation region